MLCWHAKREEEKLKYRKKAEQQFILLVFQLNSFSRWPSCCRHRESHKSRWVFEFINLQINKSHEIYSMTCMSVAPEHNRQIERDTTKTMKTTTPTKIDSSSCQLISVDVSLPFCQPRKKTLRRKNKVEKSEQSTRSKVQCLSQERLPHRKTIN